MKFAPGPEGDWIAVELVEVLGHDDVGPGSHERACAADVGREADGHPQHCASVAKSTVSLVDFSADFLKKYFLFLLLKLIF